MRWKQTAKRIAYWTIPPGFHEYIQSRLTQRLFRPVVSPEVQAEFARNSKFLNIHQGQRCFILATGPSINKQDLKPLKNEICFAASLFFLHKDIKEINPQYHVRAPNHPPFDFEVPQKSFEGLSQAYSRQTTCFFGHNDYEYSFRNFVEQNPQFKNDNIYYLNYCHAQPLDETNYNNPAIWDICKSLFSPRTVIYCAIQIAVYMGFKEIYLLGCDHDYLANLTRRSSAHFYEDKEGIDDSQEWPSTEEHFLRYHFRWKQYRLMGEHLETKGVHIYNATEGGLLDVFPRVNYESLFKKSVGGGLTQL